MEPEPAQQEAPAQAPKTKDHHITSNLPHRSKHDQIPSYVVNGHTVKGDTNGHAGNPAYGNVANGSIHGNAINGNGNENDIVNGNPKINAINDNADTNGSTKMRQKPRIGQPRNGQFSPQALKSRATHQLASTKSQAKGNNKPSGGFDTTPLPDAPQGYDVRFRFHYATNIPPADISTGVADPFIFVVLKGNNPKRHKDDPDLKFRTRTIRNTAEPKWEEEWIVANVPPNGFTLKCRMYDEDWPDSNDRLGNVTIVVPQVYDGWEGIPTPGKEFAVKKRTMSKRALVFKSVASAVHLKHDVKPRICISIEVLRKSDPPFAQMCTIGPTVSIKHFSAMIGWLVGTKVNANEEADHQGGSQQESHNGSDMKNEHNEPQKYE